jgi:phospholipase C
MSKRLGLVCCAGLISTAALVACGGGSGGGASVPPVYAPPPPAKAGKYFTHIVILVQENRTFDNLFATFPGADGTTIGKTHDGTVRLRKGHLAEPFKPGNNYRSWLRDFNGGRMNGFDLNKFSKVRGTYVYRYVDPSEIQPYWSMAKQYVLSDHMFQTQGSGSFTAHQDLIRGGTQLDSMHAVIDFPSGAPWGCDAPPGTVTSLVTRHGTLLYDEGPRPCYKYATLGDSLDAKNLSWRYYSPGLKNFQGALWEAFDAVASVRYGSEWNATQVSPETNVLTDISRNTLPALSWVIPDFQNSDHPGGSRDTGPSWVAQIVNGIGQSPAWKETAILIVWDDWGGWYDHVAPPGPRRFGGLGFRVPLIVVSPYAKAGYVSHNEYEFGSIIRFVEDNWNLARLGTTDVRANDFVKDFFDFTRAPRKFKSIAAKYSRSYFMHQPPSNRPVDDE